MIAITARRLSRENFVNWMAQAVAGDPTLPRDAGAHGRKPNEVTLAWPDLKSNARPIVCVAERDLQEFFAFVSTYSTTVRPFTAYFRVMPLELIEILENADRERGNQMQIARMVAGASIADVWMAAARQAERPSNVLPLLQSSLSVVLGQSVLAGYSEAAFQWVLQEWMMTRASQSDAATGRSVEGTSIAWRLVNIATTRILPRRSLQEYGGPIASFIRDAVEAGAIRPEMLRSLSEIAGPELDLEKMLAASREERINRFNAALADLKRRGETDFRSQFLAGLMLAIAGNGSFELIRSAREFGGWLDGAATWFGICASLFEESNVLAYANSVGRRIVRDLLREDDPFDVPRADIASTELRFIGGGNADMGQLGAYARNSIEVEILPNVVTRMLSNQGDDSVGSAEQREALLRTLDELSYLASRARRMMLDRDGGERQGDLYKSKRPNRK
ncbi:hypothetical protein IVA88_25315 [Bradyrhizobium sp. 149]|uniref:hypothetical protein n=1 Tax=Bradyrhizobium sp. 149 TaxID=2782624 RepID=UPI001FF707A0|nr:hypothetical protein [Bradyrhizobium sp. 149]MCK1654741.1 hypothetical protein [Bradyrhizobium sp. 149]